MSKGGTNTSNTEIPAWLENAAIESVNKARDVSQIGYVPYYGPDVAAFSPMQQQSMQSTGSAASAFGLAPQGFDAMAGMPQAQTFAGGVQGYSSAPLYEQSLDKLFANAPAQYAALSQQFIDPFTGAAPQSGYGATPMQQSQMVSGGGGDGYFNQDGVGGSVQSNNGGEHYGVNEQYNPYGYSNPTEDISGDGVIDYRDMSFGEAGRRDIGFGENFGNLLKGVTGVGAIGSGMDYAEGLADGFTPSPSNGLLSQSSGAMEQAEAQRVMEASARRYADRLAQEAKADRVAQLRAADMASDAAAAKARAAKIAADKRAYSRSTVNSGGNGTGAAQRTGSTYSGGGKAAASGYGGISGGGGR